MTKIYDYLDFKLYLKDYYIFKKSSNKNFSYRYIAQKIGFKSAGQFTQILKGQLNLSQKLLPRFISFLKLNARESEYFELLVNFNQTKNHSDKGKLYERILSFKEVKSITINPSQYKFYQKWYYAAIRDILSIYDFNGDYRKLANRLEPSISTSEARDAIKLLLKLNMIEKKNGHIYTIKEPLISTPIGDIFSTALANYASEMLDMAKNAVNEMPKNERSISWIGASLSKKAFENVQEEIAIFRNKIMAIAKNDTHPERVYHFNIQCFPLSKKLNCSNLRNGIDNE